MGREHEHEDEGRSYKNICLKFSNCLREYNSIRDILDHFKQETYCKDDERNADLNSFIDQVSQKYLYNCEECGASFSKEEWLEKHSATHQEQPKHIDCKENMCKFKFVTELALELHTSSCHPEAKLECNICKAMVTNGDFKEHVMSHAVKCTQCDKIFAHTGVLIKRLQKLKQKNLNGLPSPQKTEVEPSQDVAIAASSLSPNIQTNPDQIAILHPNIVGQQPFQHIIQVPVSNIQYLNVNQMSHFLQINNPQGHIRFQQ